MKNKTFFILNLLLAFLTFYSSTELMAEEIKVNLRQLTKNLPVDSFCWHSDGQEILFSSKGWIYSLELNSGDINKLIPGYSPQWIEGGKRFLYFLDVGYAGMSCEVWSADREGESRLRLLKGDISLGPHDTPTVNPAGKIIAFKYTASTADGSFEQIRLLELNRSLHTPPVVRIILVAPFATNIHIINWLDDDHLAIMRDGQVWALDINRVEGLYFVSEFPDYKKVKPLENSFKGMIKISYQAVGKRSQIPPNCEVSADGQLLAEVVNKKVQRHTAETELLIKRLKGEEKTVKAAEGALPARYFGPPRFSPKGLKLAFIKHNGDERYFHGDLWLADLAEVEKH